MTTTTNTMSANERHILTLIRHGAQIATPDNGRVALTLDFYRKAVEGCAAGGWNAVTYDLVLPGIDAPMMLAVHIDGHVDSGSVQSVCACLDR